MTLRHGWPSGEPLPPSGGTFWYTKVYQAAGTQQKGPGGWAKTAGFGGFHLCIFLGGSGLLDLGERSLGS